VRKDLVIARLARVEGLVAAYLFGSQARGTADATSDFDVGLDYFDLAPVRHAYPARTPERAPA
jgi:predicted nucleotidyltransferase